MSDIRRLVREEQQRRAQQQRDLAASKTLVQPDYLSASSSDEAERRKRPREKRDLSPKKLAHKEKKRGILKAPSQTGGGGGKKKVKFDDTTSVREIPKDDANRGAVMLPGDRLLLAAFKARSALWLSHIEGVTVQEEIEEETNEPEPAPQAEPINEDKSQPSQEEGKPKSTINRHISTISSIENAEAAYRDVITPRRSEAEAPEKKRGNDFFDENDAMSNEGCTDYSIVISSNFDKEDELENQFKQFEMSIRKIEEAQSAAVRSSETLERMQTELKQEVDQTSVALDYVSALRERVNAKGRALSERTEKRPVNVDVSVNEDEIDLTNDVQVDEDWWRSKSISNG